MKLAPQQDAAAQAVNKWLRDPAGKQFFYLAGYAGTGKTTIARHLAEDVGTVCFAAFTGKAALVLQTKGCYGASTIHSLIYKIEDEKKAEPNFILNPDGPIKDADLVIIDECFAAGTLVDTPAGSRQVQDIIPGDEILNASGIDTVVATKKKEAESLVLVNVSGTTIAVSDNHPFFTERGLVVAGELKPGDALLLTASAMRLLRDIDHSKEQPAPKTLLQHQLLGAVVFTVPRLQSENLHSGTGRKSGFSSEEISSFRNPGSIGASGSYKEVMPITIPGSCDKDQQRLEADGAQTSGARREWEISSNSASSASYGAREELDDGICCSDGIRSITGADALQAGLSQPGIDGLHRGGWRLPLFHEGQSSRCAEDRISDFKRVESVEVLERSDPRLDQYRDADGKLYLYDLQARRHSSFSVNSFLVHNCSMVGPDLGADLLSFGKKVLVLGDPAQLPPISGEGYFTSGEPDFMLTEVHRQAQDNPIIHMSMLIREGHRLELGNYGASRVIMRKDLEQKSVLDADQVLVGLNKTRRLYNARMRKLLGFDGNFQLKDRVVCLKNNKQKGLLNGGIWEVDEIREQSKDITTMVVMPLDSGMTKMPTEVRTHHAWVRGEERELDWRFAKTFQPFDFAYALTCHKAQGSQWNNVLVFDESASFQENRDNWLYTAVTRAAERVEVVL